MAKALLDSSKHYHHLQHEYAAHGIQAEKTKIRFRDVEVGKDHQVRQMRVGQGLHVGEIVVEPMGQGGEARHAAAARGHLQVEGIAGQELQSGRAVENARSHLLQAEFIIRLS